MKITGLVAMAAMAGASLWARHRVAPPRATVTVCIESDPHAPMRSRALASEMFASIGVRIDWREWNSCPAGAIAVHLSYVPNRQTPKNLGFAEPYQGTRTVVFLDRVEDLNPEGGPCVLAHVLVHEITHMLEGISRHSATGIMKARWDRDDYFEMSRKPLPFAQEDIDLIYDGLKKRQAALAIAATAPAQRAASDLKLTLVVYNHAHVGEDLLNRAGKTASEIFERAGVELVWLDGFAYAAERRKAEIPAPEDPATLVVKLQPASEAVRYGVRSGCEGIGFESGAIVFVRDATSSASAATHLGHVIAHEIGHILLGPDAHSIVGIMRGTMLQQDWEQAAQGTLGFTRSQNQQIRTWIANRGRTTDAQRIR